MSEIDEILQTMDETLLALRNERDVLPQFQVLYRHAHTIKGLAAFCREHTMVSVCHRLEDLLQAVVEGHIVSTPELKEVVAIAIDFLNSTVASISLHYAADIDEQAVIQRIDALLATARLH